MATTKISRWLVGPVFAGILLLSACADHPRNVVYVRTPPPPPIRETILVSPGPGYFWVGGFHSWNGNSYVWVPGRWERIPGRRHAWAPGHWVHGRHGWYWVEGHWR
jgi:hypothetical protein